MKKFEYEEKKKFLIELMKEYYPQGDDYFCYRNKKGKWRFGYSNDYPLQHGSGEEIFIPDSMVNIIMNKTK